MDQIQSLSMMPPPNQVDHVVVVDEALAVIVKPLQVALLTCDQREAVSQMSGVLVVPGAEVVVYQQGAARVLEVVEKAKLGAS